MKMRPERRTRTAPAATAVLVLLVALIVAAPARATILFGSDLTQLVVPPPRPGPCETGPAPCSGILVATRPGNAYPSASPVSGRVVAFDIKTADATTVGFQIFDLIPEIGGQISASANSTARAPAVSLPGPGSYQVPVALHIQAGQYIGLEASAPAAVGACGVGAEMYWFTPPLAAGTSMGDHVQVACELLLNAVVVPGSSVIIERGTLGSPSGRVGLGVSVPGPGDLTLTGRGITTRTRQVKAAGFTDQRLSVTRALRERLVRAGSTELHVTATFAPEGGTPATRSKLVRFDVVGRGSRRRSDRRPRAAGRGRRKRPPPPLPRS
jgi:hypothetical protein